MARRIKQQKPSDPQAAHAARRKQSFEAVGLQPEAANLPQNEAVEVIRNAEERGGRRVDHDVAKRTDAFDALKEGMRAGCYDAARRLERDLLTRRGEGDRGRIVERVDCDEAMLDLADRIIAAAESVDAVKERLSRRDFWLLVELIQPSREHEGWRGAVYYVTGEANRDAQGAAVRAACVNLQDAYVAMDERPRKAA